MTDPKLHELAVALAEARVKEADAKRREDELFDEIKSTGLYVTYDKVVTERKTASKDESKIKGKLAEAMIKAHEEDPNAKAYRWGIITEGASEVLEIEDEAALIAWAIEQNIPGVLQVDQAALQKVAGVLNPPGVKVTTKANIGTRINRDLSDLIESEEADGDENPTD